MVDPLVVQTFGQYEFQDRLGRGGGSATSNEVANEDLKRPRLAPARAPYAGVLSAPGMDRAGYGASSRWWIATPRSAESTSVGTGTIAVPASCMADRNSSMLSRRVTSRSFRI